MDEGIGLSPPFHGLTRADYIDPTPRIKSSPARERDGNRVGDGSGGVNLIRIGLRRNGLAADERHDGGGDGRNARRGLQDRGGNGTHADVALHDLAERVQGVARQSAGGWPSVYRSGCCGDNVGKLAGGRQDGLLVRRNAGAGGRVEAHAGEQETGTSAPRSAHGHLPNGRERFAKRGRRRGVDHPRGERMAFMKNPAVDQAALEHVIDRCVNVFAPSPPRAEADEAVKDASGFGFVKCDAFVVRVHGFGFWLLRYLEICGQCQLPGKASGLSWREVAQ